MTSSANFIREENDVHAETTTSLPLRETPAAFTSSTCDHTVDTCDNIIRELSDEYWKARETIRFLEEHVNDVEGKLKHEEEVGNVMKGVMGDFGKMMKYTEMILEEQNELVTRLQRDNAHKDREVKMLNKYICMLKKRLLELELQQLAALVGEEDVVKIEWNLFSMLVEGIKGCFK
jgi:hypothetical protein